MHVKYQLLNIFKKNMNLKNTVSCAFVMPQLQARGAGNVTGIKSFNGRNGIRKEINENDGGMDVWLS